MSSRFSTLWRSERAPVAAVVAVPLLLLSPALLPGRVLSAADLLLGTYMYGEARPPGFVPSNALIGDTVFQFTAWRPFVIRELRAGRLPFWNPHAFCGSPFLGNSQSAVFDVLNLPYLVTGDPLGPTVWVALLRMWVAGLGTYLFARRLGLSRSSSALGAVAYECGGFMLVFLMFPHAGSAAWFSWVMLAAEYLGTRGGVRPVAGLALALAACLLGGHAEVAFFAALAASFYAFVRRGQARAWRPRELLRVTAGLALAGVLTAAIAGVQILPLLETLTAGSSPEARAQLAQEPINLWPWQFPWSRFVLLFFPYLYGRPVHGEPSFPPMWTNFCEYSGPYVSSFAAILALLAMVTAARRSPARPLLLLWCTAWFFSVYFPPLLALARHLPALDVAVPQRCVFVALFAAAVLAGLGLDRLCAFSERRRRRTDIVGAAALGVAGMAGLAIGWWLHAGAAGLATVVRVLLSAPLRSVFVGLEQRLQTQKFELAPLFASLYVLPWAILMLAAAIWLFLERRTGRTRGIAAVALVAADLLWFGHGFNPAIPRAQAFPRTAAVETLARVANGGRVLVLDHGLPPNCGTFYGISDILGYDAIGRKRLERLLRIAGPFPPGPLEARLVNFDRYESWVLDVLGVRAIASPRPLPVTYLNAAPGQGSVYYCENPRVFPFVWFPEGVVAVRNATEAERKLGGSAFDPRTATVVESDEGLVPGGARGNLRWSRPAPTRIEIEADLAEGGLVVVSESYDPGWQARVDGSRVPTYPCDLALLGVQLPAGAHRVTFVFRPRTWPLALVMSSLGLVGIVAILFGARRTANRTEGHELQSRRPFQAPPCPP